MDLSWMTRLPDLIHECGFEPYSLLTSEEEVGKRLMAILQDKILRFNPYSVDDETLLACAERARWQPWPSLTQMVIFHFHDIRSIAWNGSSYDALFFHIGDDPEELHVPAGQLTQNLTYPATKRLVHVKVNGLSLTNFQMVEKMQGKDYFVSHSISAVRPDGKRLPAYRMFRLLGSAGKRASIIRRRMIEAKIAMLQEIVKHPYCSDYLHCRRDFIDYFSPISKALKSISNFPNKDK